MAAAKPAIYLDDCLARDFFKVGVSGRNGRRREVRKYTINARPEEGQVFGRRIALVGTG